MYLTLPVQARPRTTLALEDMAGGRVTRLDLEGDRPRFSAYSPGLTHLLTTHGDGGPVLDTENGFPVFDLSTIRELRSPRIELGPRHRDDAQVDPLPAALARSPEGVWRLLGETLRAWKLVG